MPRRLRITGAGRFDAVLAARMRHMAGPLTVFAAPNNLDHPRLGLAVPRAAGNAVQRNRFKRLIREAFRHSQHELPVGYDFIVQVRRHETMTLNEYQTHLMAAGESLERKWQARQRRANEDE